MFQHRTKTAARGKWRGILLSFGVPDNALTGKHGPCPMCGGKDRFRWDNKNGNGTYICGACGAGDGMQLAMEFTGKGFREVAKLIDRMVGNIQAYVPQPKMSDAKRLDLLRNTFKLTTPVKPGDLADRYLKARGVDELVYPESLRFAAALPDGEGGRRPAMVAVISGPDGALVSMHRTFLDPGGSSKARMKAPRKLMPGSLPPGSSIRLGEYVGGGPIGIAEGIETALSASAIYGMPVWAALNTSMLKTWIPPEGCTEVAIFGDNDKNSAGQSAADELAGRLRADGIDVTINFPDCVGEDFNDVLLRRAKGG